MCDPYKVHDSNCKAMTAENILWVITAEADGASEFSTVCQLLKSNDDDQWNSENEDDVVITLRTKYYSTDILVKNGTQKMRSTEGDVSTSNKELFSQSAAFILVLKENESNAGGEYCQRMWDDKLSDLVSPNVLVLLLVLTEGGEQQETELIQWAVTRGIEVITPRLCREDGLSVRQRVMDALHCAPWSGVRWGENRMVHGNGLDQSAAHETTIEQNISKRENFDNGNSEEEDEDDEWGGFHTAESSVSLIPLSRLSSVTEVRQHHVDLPVASLHLNRNNVGNSENRQVDGIDINSAFSDALKASRRREGEGEIERGDVTQLVELLLHLDEDGPTMEKQ